MTPERAWAVIFDSVRIPWSNRPISVFQKVIRKRFKRKKYGSFRVPEYEEILAQSKEHTILYARCVIMGKLPEKMHRKMLAWGIADPNDREIKFYFDVCEGKASYSRPYYWPTFQERF